MFFLIRLFFFLGIVLGVNPAKGADMLQNQNYSIDLKVEKYTLENGMRVLLYPERHIPQVYHELIIKIGSVDEVKGKTGLAHLFEHMMFKGTKKYTGQEYEERLESIGARNNAYTSRDYTGYHTIFPSHKLEMVLEMEAERLESLQITEDHLEKELEVVKEERRLRTDNNPNDIFEPIMKMVFKTHSYGRPIIGWMEDLEKMSIKDCKAFYQSYYAPNNAILILAGNFKVSQAKRWIKKYYGALKPFDVNRPEDTVENKQEEKRVSEIRRAVTAPTLAFAYRVPKVGEKASYALEVLNRVLTNGESSRLYKLLVYDQKLALSVGGFYYGLKKAGVFLLYIKMAPQARLEDLEALVKRELRKVRETEVTEIELLKSKRFIMNEYISSVKSLSGKAGSLIAHEFYFNDYKQMFKELEKYEKVTSQEIKEYADSYLEPHRVSIVKLLPQKKQQ